MTWFSATLSTAFLPVGRGGLLWPPEDILDGQLFFFWTMGLRLIEAFPYLVVIAAVCDMSGCSSGSCAGFVVVLSICWVNLCALVGPWRGSMGILCRAM